MMEILGQWLVALRKLCSDSSGVHKRNYCFSKKTRTINIKKYSIFPKFIQTIDVIIFCATK